MAFIDVSLSACVAYGFAGGPEWSTQLVELENGREQRNAEWLYPKHRYSAQYLNIKKDARDEVLAAFHACRGRLHAFRFKDANDFIADGQVITPNFGTLDPVQLVKRYTFGSETSVRLIQAPVFGRVEKGDIPVDVYIDTATGLAVPTNPWEPGVYTWSGEFAVWVRFDSDYNSFSLGAPDAHTSDIDLVEVRR